MNTLEIFTILSFILIVNAWNPFANVRLDSFEVVQFQTVSGLMDGISTLDFCLTEDKSLHLFYIPYFPSDNLYLGQAIYLSPYEKGKLITSDLSYPSESLATIYHLENFDRKRLRSLTLHEKREECGVNYKTVLHQFFEGENSNQLSNLLNIASNISCIGLPSIFSASHYHNSIQFSPSSFYSYSTFLSSLNHIRTGLPSLIDILSSNMPPKSLFISSTIMVYFNRFVTKIEYQNGTEEYKSNFCQIKSRKGEYKLGYIGSIVYGHRLKLDLSFNMSLTLDMRVEDFSKELTKILQLDPSESIHSELFQKLKTNMTVTIEKQRETETYLDYDVKDIVEIITQWKQNILREESYLNARPIAVEVFDMEDFQQVPFHFTQCVTSHLPPIHLLILLSNLLIFGIIMGLIVALISLSFCGYFILSAIFGRLLELGRLPAYVRVEQFQFHFLYLWPFGQHQHAD